MVIKTAGGVRRVALVREALQNDTGEIEVYLKPCKRAGRNLRQEAKRRTKDISKVMQCGGSADFLPDLRTAHRVERRFLTAQLSELVQSGGYQADMSGEVISFRVQPMSLGEARTVLVLGPTPKVVDHKMKKDDWLYQDRKKVPSYLFRKTLHRHH